MTKDDWEMLAKLVERAWNIAAGEDRVTSTIEWDWNSSFQDRLLAAVRFGDMAAMRALLDEPCPTD